MAFNKGGGISDYFDVTSITSMVSRVQNVVMNYSEFEIKVRDATNNEPWGASSTLMQEIAAGTNNYQHFQEIMDTIYKKFQETGPNWRQAYKALQLLEYIIKQGSERVVDYTRDHLYDLKVLKNFNYIDDKGKDQGINVRNRAKEIMELLSNTEKVKEERKKARENRNKYGGVSSTSVKYGGFGSESFTTSSGSKYGGFGSESFSSTGNSSKYGGFGSESYNNSSGNSNSGGFHDDDDKKYDGYSSYQNDDDPSSPPKSTPKKLGIIMKDSSTSSSSTSSATITKPTETPRPAVNLLDLDEAPSGGNNDGGDDWGDFASAPQEPKAHASTANDFGIFESYQPTPSSLIEPVKSTPTVQMSSTGSLSSGFASFSAPTTPMGQQPVNNLLGGFSSSNSIQPMMQSTQPAFGQPIQPRIQPVQSATTTQFAAFGNGTFAGKPLANQFPVMNSSTPNFAAFSQTSSSSSFQGLTPSTSTIQPTSTTQPRPDDPFSKLVSLDATSLTSFGNVKKPEVQAAPSLNSLNTFNYNPQGASGGFANFGSGGVGGMQQGGGVKPWVGSGSLQQQQQTQTTQQSAFGAFGGSLI